MNQRSRLALWLHGSTLKTRLLVLLATVLLLTHSVSSVWVWHESREQIIELVELAANPNHSRHELEKEKRETLLALVIPPVLLGSIGLLLAYLVISWLTRPLERLSDLLRQRSSSNLEPLELSEQGPELQAVVQAVNELLARLSLTLQSERQFTADVAHELRTPLAGIRLNLELMQQTGVQGVQPLIERLDGLHHTVEQLLNMARLERNVITGISGEVDFVREVFTPLEPELRQMLARRGQILHCELAPLRMRGEVSLLQMLLRNLIENTSRYATPQTPVQLQLRAGQSPTGMTAELVVRDVGSGVAPEQLSRLTAAFTRLDSRGNGIGLGLNIVARVCALHQATLQFENAEQPLGLRVRVGFAVGVSRTTDPE